MCNLIYEVQEEPKGLAQAFLIGEEFVRDDACVMVLVDNIFYGNGFVEMLENARSNVEDGFVANFGYGVRDPYCFGIMELDNNKNIISVEETLVKPSKRGELEIITLNDFYLKEGRLRAELLGGGFSWFDAGTFESKLEAENFIYSVQKHRGKVIACLEQIAFTKGWIDIETLEKSAREMSKNSYGQYLSEVKEKVIKKV